VPVRIVLCPDPAAAFHPHFSRQVGAIKKESNGLGKLFRVPCRIQQAGDAVRDHFPA
jgi:hypothetical protein